MLKKRKVKFMTTNDDILFDQKGHVGLITLNRPKALNALNHGMAVALHKQLDIWAVDDTVHAVVITGAGEKGFCAGGDVVSLYHSGLKWKEGGDAASTDWRDFFHDEYLMNSAIHHFPKPYIAIMDGITMGGGVGVSVHGSHRIATERTMMAMPETGLGLIPDVGGGYFLPRLPGETGMFLALKGERVKAADCLYLGICHAFMTSDTIEAFIETLASFETINDQVIAEVIATFAGTPEGGRIEAQREDIDRLFAGDSLDQIFTNLENDAKTENGEWAMGQLAKLKKMSPTSMKVTFEQLKRGKSLDFNDNLINEFRAVCLIMAENDFYEGVRAILLDKDMAPKWNPTGFDGVTSEIVDAHFASRMGDKKELDI